jgi:glycosylphosphatidylinositol transamidase (GPIT) subunit GPI8
VRERERMCARDSSVFSFLHFQHHSDSDIGVAIIDRFTYYTLEFFQKYVRPDSNTTIAQLVPILFVFFPLKFLDLNLLKIVVRDSIIVHICSFVFV